LYSRYEIELVLKWWDLDNNQQVFHWNGEPPWHVVPLLEFHFWRERFGKFQQNNISNTGFPMQVMSTILSIVRKYITMYKPEIILSGYKSHEDQSRGKLYLHLARKFQQESEYKIDVSKMIPFNMENGTQQIALATPSVTQILRHLGRKEGFMSESLSFQQFWDRINGPMYQDVPPPVKYDLADYGGNLTGSPINGTEGGASHELRPLSHEDMCRYGADDVADHYTRMHAGRNPSGLGKPLTDEEFKKFLGQSW
jgi:hypothetical protein